METEKPSINIASMKRIMLKLSGEILVGKQKYGLDPEKLLSIAEDICNVYLIYLDYIIHMKLGNYVVNLKVQSILHMYTVIGMILYYVYCIHTASKLVIARDHTLLVNLA